MLSLIQPTKQRIISNVVLKILKIVWETVSDISICNTNESVLFLAARSTKEAANDAANKVKNTAENVGKNVSTGK